MNAEERKSDFTALKNTFAADLSTDFDPSINTSPQAYFNGLADEYIGKEQDSLDPNSALFKFISKLNDEQKMWWGSLGKARNAFFSTQQRVETPEGARDQNVNPNHAALPRQPVPQQPSMLPGMATGLQDRGHQGQGIPNLRMPGQFATELQGVGLEGAGRPPRHNNANRAVDHATEQMGGGGGGVSNGGAAAPGPGSRHRAPPLHNCGSVHRSWGQANPLRHHQLQPHFQAAPSPSVVAMQEISAMQNREVDALGEQANALGELAKVVQALGQNIENIYQNMSKNTANAVKEIVGLSSSWGRASPMQHHQVPVQPHFQAAPSPLGEQATQNVLVLVSALKEIKEITKIDAELIVVEAIKQNAASTNRALNSVDKIVEYLTNQGMVQPQATQGTQPRQSRTPQFDESRTAATDTNGGE
ncbi:hypothetical protein SEMRO_1867_G302560.1 [Seminavis robusta]|uniref:Uncharacterized protein n=1 Tax=Seminavis robusta TaxID=568900 RepID=A0A9N8HVU0_9STRA|nr:hypothetical protein SEMRO_1867_G302560.1 [Seminavis robusta]|eukprot:Sro1867_g302560.1 n/a (418) ;mRNA; r:5601-6942